MLRCTHHTPCHPKRFVTLSRSPLSSITYWNQFLRFSVENNIPIDDESIARHLKPYSNEDFVPFELFKDLVKGIWEASDKPWLGLEFASQIQLSSHGSLGFAVSHGVDLEECLDLITRYYQTRLQAISLDSIIQGDTYVLALNETCDWQPIRTLLYEVVLCSFVNVIEFIIGKEVAQCQLRFPYPAPAWADKYPSQFPCAFSFGHSQASIRIPKRLLKIKSITSNKQTVSLASSQCDLELARVKNTGTISAKLIQLISDSSNFALSAENAAKALNLSKSTLARRLKAENTSYSQIMSDLKRERAKALLTTTRDSIESIALALDYEDSSNFTRSCKRWFDCTPSEYREKFSLKLVTNKP